MNASEIKQYIFEKEKIEYILNEIGCHGVRRNNKDIRCGRPNHNNTSAISVKLNEHLSTTMYKSTEDTLKGDLITLIMDIENVAFKVALKRLHALLGLKYTNTHKVATQAKETPLDIFKSVKRRVTQKFNIHDIEHFDEDVMLGEYTPNLTLGWLREGITSKTAREFNIGYDYGSKRIIIPHYSYDQPDKVVGIVGRTTIENYELFNIPKYLHLKPYPKTVNLYGLSHNYKGIIENGYLCLGEAEKSVLKRHSRLDPTWVALGSHSLSDEQFKIICGLDIKEVIIALDKGISEQHIWSIAERFWGIKQVSYIWDKYDLLDDKESPADKLDKVYRWLFKNRVKYDSVKRREYLKLNEICGK